MPFMAPDAPKVEVSALTDMKFNASGKSCGPMHRPWPAGLRSASHVAGLKANAPVIAGPGTALENELFRRSERGQEFRDRMTRTSSTLGPGPAWAEIIAPEFRPSSSSESVRPAGLRSLGPVPSRPTTTGSMSSGLDEPRVESLRKSRSAGSVSCGLDGTYNAAKHTWAHPLARAEQKRLASTSEEPGSWAWTLFKAKDHLGFGPDGIVDRRDGVTCAVSADTPAWFVGTRTHAGPMTCKKVPVRRAPCVDVQGKQLKVTSRTFQRNDDFSCTTTLHDRPIPPTPMQRPKSRSGENYAARHNHLEFGGCQVK